MGVQWGGTRGPSPGADSGAALLELRQEGSSGSSSEARGISRQWTPIKESGCMVGSTVGSERQGMGGDGASTHQSVSIMDVCVISCLLQKRRGLGFLRNQAEEAGGQDPGVTGPLGCPAFPCIPTPHSGASEFPPCVLPVDNLSHCGSAI